MARRTKKASITKAFEKTSKRRSGRGAAKRGGRAAKKPAAEQGADVAKMPASVDGPFLFTEAQEQEQARVSAMMRSVAFGQVAGLNPVAWTTHVLNTFGGYTQEQLSRFYPEGFPAVQADKPKAIELTDDAPLVNKGICETQPMSASLPATGAIPVERASAPEPIAAATVGASN